MPRTNPSSTFQKLVVAGDWQVEYYVLPKEKVYYKLYHKNGNIWEERRRGFMTVDEIMRKSDVGTGDESKS